jgi:Phage integrase, N-terminal SAM-like domain
MLSLGTVEGFVVAENAPPYGGGAKLLDRVRWSIRMRHQFHGKQHPATLGPDQVTQFLSSLATERRLSASTQNEPRRERD